MATRLSACLLFEQKHGRRTHTQPHHHTPRTEHTGGNGKCPTEQNDRREQIDTQRKHPACQYELRSYAHTARPRGNFRRSARYFSHLAPVRTQPSSEGNCWECLSLLLKHRRRPAAFPASPRLSAAVPGRAVASREGLPIGNARSAGSRTTIWLRRHPGPRMKMP